MVLRKYPSSSILPTCTSAMLLKLTGKAWASGYVETFVEPVMCYETPPKDK